jgi:hypothetical protein
MTPAEVRAIVERVVAEHGQGWHAQEYAATWRISEETLFPPAFVSVRGDDGMATPRMAAGGDVECARAVALWPEMQRLVQMLREALR